MEIFNKNAINQTLSESLISRVFCALVMMSLFLCNPAHAQEKCQPINKKRIKIEGYIAKKFRKNRKAIIKEFTELGNSKASLRIYRMG